MEIVGHTKKLPAVFTVTALFLCLLCTRHVGAQYAKASYFMDSTSDCYISGYLLIKTDGVVNINGQKPSGSTSDVLKCTVRFKPDDNRDIIDVSFTHLTISDDGVTLRVDLTGDVTPKGAGSYTLSAGSTAPNKMESTGGIVTISLTRLSLTDSDYSFGITVRVYKKDDSLVGDDEKPVGVGLVVGIVAGVIIFIVFIAVLAVCCYRRKKEQYRARGADEHKVDLTTSHSPPRSFGIDNAARNGDYLPRDEGSPPMKKAPPPMRSQMRPSLNRDRSDSESDSREEIVRTYNGSPAKSAPLRYENERNNVHNQRQGLRRTPDSRNDRRGEENRQQPKQGLPPRSPVVSALHNNPRFRASFHANEQEAEERARKISGGADEAANDSDVSMTETWNTTFDTNFDDDPRPPAGSFIKPPTLPPVPMSPRSPVRRENTASIHRAPRPSSSSSEIENLQGGGEVSMNPDGEGPPAPSEIVPIRVQDPHSPTSKRKADAQRSRNLDPARDTTAPEPHKSSADPQNSESPRPASKPKKSASSKKSKPKPDNPDTDKKPKAKTSKRAAEPAASRPEEGRPPAQESRSKPKEGPEYEGRFRKSDSVRKSKSKSPRLGRSRSTGTGMEDNDSVGQPATPRGYRAVPPVTADDYEDSDVESNYNPLRRTGSKNSLYASRSSLYARRRRKNSLGESVYSFAHDDMDYERPDRDSFKERSLSRRDRGFRSLGDLEMELRDQKTRSTQTLRECATQTGKGFANVTPGNKMIMKKNKPRSVSSSHTQTAKSKPRNLDSSSSSSGVTRLQERKNSVSSASGRSKSRDRANSASSVGGRAKQRKDASDGRSRPTRTEERGAGPGREKPKPKAKPRRGPSGTGHRSDDEDMESIRTGMTGPVDSSSVFGGSQAPAAGMPGPQAAYAPQSFLPHPAGYPPHLAYMQATGQPPVMMPYAPVGTVPHHAAAVQPNPPAPMVNPGVAVVGGGAKPSVSKWDMLCRMTDGDSSKAGDWNDSASVAGSVFSNPYAGHQVPAGYSSAMSDYAASEQSGPTRSKGGWNRTSRTSGRSAWDALKEMADQESQYAPSESNV